MTVGDTDRWRCQKMEFNANWSNSTYGKYNNNSSLKNKVIPDSVNLLPCMKLAPGWE